jgi:arsenate reductase
MLLCYPKCTTCKKARQWLDGHGFSYTYRNIMIDKPSYEELREWHAKTKLPLRRFFNTSGRRYKELGLKDTLLSMNEHEQLSLLSTDGMLVKRPILVDKDVVIVGFKQDEWAKHYRNP